MNFLTEEGDTLASIQAAVAESQQERNEGLMNVSDLPENRGMLFLFEEQQELSFWMANTPLSLDIIYVDEEGEIVRIHHNTTPYSEKSFPSGEPARYVVEVNGGFCVSHDIREGMRVEFAEE